MVRRSWTISTSAARFAVLDALKDGLTGPGGPGRRLTLAALTAADELLMNALYDAGPFADCPRDVPIVLPEPHEVELAVEWSADEVVITCRDTFGTFDPESIARVHRGPGEAPLRAGDGPGSGIGLSRIQKEGGQLQVETVPGQSTRVSVRLTRRAHQTG